MKTEDLKLRQIYFVEEIVLDEEDFEDREDEYVNADEIGLVATGGTVIRIYELISGKIKLIDTIFGSTDQKSKKLVKGYLNGNYKFVKQL